MRKPETSRTEVKQLAHRVSEHCRLNGKFTLRSGRVSDLYFDKYLFESAPELLREIATSMAPLIPENTEVIAGLELGGVPVVTALSLVTGIPAAFVRKVAKTYGTAKLAEGAEIANRRVLVVEDVITTGGQVVSSTSELRALGAIVGSVLCVIDRTDGDHANLDTCGVSVLSLFTAADFE